MSDYLAIAAVTATLRNLLEAGIAGKPEMNDVKVTALPPDKAREGTTTNQVNLFLYQTATRPRSTAPGATRTFRAPGRSPRRGRAAHRSAWSSTTC